MRIDLNCDMGESPVRLADGTDLALLDVVTSANIACGGHAGDDHTMRETARAAFARGVAIGAHPSYPDPANFGRVSMHMPIAALEATIFEQISALDRIVRSIGGGGDQLRHVKPHGALYHDATTSPQVAAALAAAVARVNLDLILVAIAGSPALDLWRAQGFRAVAEAFADRTYEADGTLRSRTLTGAVITDPEIAARQAVRLAMAAGTSGAVPGTLCIHSDTPHSLAIAKAARAALIAAKITVAPL